MMELVLLGLFSWLLYTPAPAQAVEPVQYEWAPEVKAQAIKKCGEGGYELLVTPLKTLDGGDQYFACTIVVPKKRTAAVTE